MLLPTALHPSTLSPHPSTPHEWCPLTTPRPPSPVPLQHCSLTQATNAVSWALAVQKQLMQVPWSTKLGSHESTRPVYLHDQCVFSGLRVRMGMHIGALGCQATGHLLDCEVTKRTRRICDFAQGGQVLVSQAVVVALQCEGAELDMDVAAVGHLASLSDSFRLMEVYWGWGSGGAGEGDDGRVPGI